MRGPGDKMVCGHKKRRNWSTWSKCFHVLVDKEPWHSSFSQIESHLNLRTAVYSNVLDLKKKSPELILRNLLQVNASMGAVIVCDYSLRGVSIQGTKWAALLKCKTNAGLKITLLFSCFFACGLRWPIGYKLSTNASDINSISAQKTVGSMLKVLWGLNSKMKNIKNDWCVVTHWLILLKMTFSCAIYGLLLIWTVTFTALLHWSKVCNTCTFL